MNFTSVVCYTNAIDTLQIIQFLIKHIKQNYIANSIKIPRNLYVIKENILKSHIDQIINILYSRYNNELMRTFAKNPSSLDQLFKRIAHSAILTDYFMRLCAYLVLLITAQLNIDRVISYHEINYDVVDDSDINTFIENY